jgi:hypothetical protein
MAAPIVLGITIRSDGSAQVNRDLKNVAKNLDDAGKSAKNSNRMFAEMAGQLKTMFAVGSIAAIAKEVFDVNREFQSLRTSLASAVGGMENAKTAFGFIQEFAAKTPYDVAQVTESFITLKNFGLKPSEEALRSYGNTAAALNKPISQMIEAVADAVTGDYERLTEFGIKAGKEGDKIAFAFQGVTTEVKDSASEIQQYLINLGNTKFGDALAAQSKTINGALSNLHDTWNTLIDNILSDTQENALGKWIQNIGAWIHWLDVQMTGAKGLDKLAELNDRIATNKTTLADHKNNSWAGDLMDGLSGYDPALLKNAIDVDLKERDRLIQSLHDQKTAQEALTGAKANGTAATQTSSDAIKDELKALNDQHQKLSLSERDYELSKLNALGMSDAAKAQAMAIWDQNHALEAKQKADKEAESSTKSLQSAYENAANSMGQSMATIGGHTKAEAMEYEVTAGSLKNLTEAKKLYLLQQAAEFDNKTLEKNAHEAAKSALDALIDKYNQLTLSARAYYASTLKTKDGLPLSPEQSAPILAQYDKNAGVEANQKNIDAARSSLESYNQTLANTIAKTTDLGATNTAIFDGALGGINTLNGAFDNMVKSLESNTKALSELHKKQVENAAFEQRAITDQARSRNNGQYLVDLKTISDNKKLYALEEERLSNENLKNSLTGIRQVASATGAMFAENTTARKAFNVVALAASVSERLADMAGLGVKAASATLTQGQGDPYTAFARIAAMGAIVASILSAAGAGTFNFSGRSVAPGPQGLSPDTGTVLGDSAAKSVSVDKTYQLLKDIHAEEYAELRSISQGIAALSSGITNVVTRLFQTGGLTTVNAPASTFKATGMLSALNSIDPGHFLRDIDPIGSKIMSALFGGKQTSSVIAQGITTGQTSLSDIIAGGNLNASQFAQIQTKTSGGWFGKDKYSTSTQYAALDAVTQTALNEVFKSMGSTMLGLANSLGMGLSNRVKNYIIPALSVDLKGLDGEAAAKKLNGVISASLDTMSTAVFGDIIGQYQQLGEGMLETAVRIVTEVAVVRDAVSRSGLSLGTNAIAIADSLVQAAGGLKEFQQQFNAFFDKFFSAAEKQSKLYETLTSSVESLNLSLPGTRDGYKKLVESLDLANAQDRERYSMLLKLSSAADSYYSGLEEANSKAQQLAEETAAKANQLAQTRRNMEIQLMEAQGRTAEALIAKRQMELDAMDSSLVPMQKAIYAAQDYAKAQDDLNTAIKTSIAAANTALDTAFNQLTKVVNAQKQEAQELLNTLTGISDKLHSALNASASLFSTRESSLYSRSQAQSVIYSAIDMAKGGGSLADVQGLDAALSELAKPTQELYGSFSDYIRDQARTTAAISELSGYADAQVSDAQKALTVLEEILIQAQLQVDVLRNVNTSMLTVPVAMENFTVKLDAATLAQTYAIQVNTDATTDVTEAMQAFITAGTAASATQLAIAQNTAAAQAAYANTIANASNVQTTASLTTTGAVMQVRSAIADLAVQISGFMSANSAAWSANKAAWTANSSAWGNLYSVWAAQYSYAYLGTPAVAGTYTSASIASSAAAANIPGFAVGINEVPYDMTANIHKGERIFPEADNEELMMRLEQLKDSEQNNAELIVEMRNLRAIVQRQQQVLDAIARSSGAIAVNTGKTADVLDGVTAGGGPMLVEVVS